MLNRTPKKLWEKSNEKRSRLILALDYYEKSFVDGKKTSFAKRRVFQKARKILGEVKDLVVGVKIGFPLTLSIGFEEIVDLISLFQDDYYFIADYKLSDIPEVNEFILNVFKEIGFDAAIMQIFQGGLNKIKHKIDIFAIVMMSHNDSKMFKDSFTHLVQDAVKAEVDGLVIGATKGEYILNARKLAPNITILCPGVIIQGAKPGYPLLVGGDFEIVGRAIIYSDDPLKIALEIVRAERNVLYK